MSVEININKVVKKYGDLTIIPGLDEHIKNGEFFTLLGPSGCGKTTLLRMIAGFNSIEGGTIAFNDKVINDIPAHERNIGMVFQSYDLFPNLTVMENILLAPVKVQKRQEDEVRKQAEELLERVGMQDYENSYPRELSGGQKQRVAIVRAMAMNPEILLLDEITASLDPEMVRGVQEIVEHLSNRDHMTMIVVTHQMNFAEKIADEVLFLEDGRILEDTPGKDFFKNPQTARAREFLDSMDF